MEKNTCQCPKSKGGYSGREEGPALGGAMLAAVGCGRYSSVEEIAEKVVKVKETVEPGPKL